MPVQHLFLVLLQFVPSSGVLLSVLGPLLTLPFIHNLFIVMVMAAAGWYLVLVLVCVILVNQWIWLRATSCVPEDSERP